MDILFLSKYFQKIHQIHKPGSSIPGFVQMNLNQIQSMIQGTPCVVPTGTTWIQSAKKASSVRTPPSSGVVSILNARMTLECYPWNHSSHRISARGSLLFMRCVSLTLTELVSAWRWEEAPSAILAKPLSDCVTVFCLRQCKSRYLNVCEIFKRYMLFSNKLNILHS